MRLGVNALQGGSNKQPQPTTPTQPALKPNHIRGIADAFNQAIDEGDHATEQTLRQILPAFAKSDQDAVAEQMVRGVPNRQKFVGSMATLGIDPSVFEANPERERAAYPTLVALADPANATDADRKEIDAYTHYYAPDHPIGKTVRQAQEKSKQRTADHPLTRYLKSSWQGLKRIPEELPKEAVKFARENANTLAEVLNFFNPGADVADAKDESAATMNALKDGRYIEASAHGLNTAAALGMTLLPGHFGQFETGAKLATGAADDASNAVASSRKAGYNPPNRPPRDFTEDYPHGAQTDEAGNLTHDIDGNPLIVGGRIAGRRVVQGGDQAIPPTEFNAIAEEGTGRSAQIVKIPGNDVGRVAVNPYTRQPEQVIIDSRLAEDEVPKVLGHEDAHVIDEIAGEIDTKGLQKELKGLYNTLNNPNRSGSEAASWGKPMTPQAAGYKGDDVQREYMAEAIRAYLTNPNYLKTEAPNTAKRIRQWVNTHPELRKIIQFNTLAGTAYAAGQAKEE